MRKNLLNEVSMSELQTMRESGMTNADIGRSLGVTEHTIWRYLGANPGRGGRVARTMPREIKAKEKAEEPQYDASLQVVNRVINLAGLQGSYTVDMRAKTVVIEGSEMLAEMKFEQFATFAQEIAAIARHLNDMHVGAEAW